MPAISKCSSIKFLWTANKCYALSLSLTGTASAVGPLGASFTQMVTELIHKIVDKYPTVNFIVEKSSDGIRINFKTKFADSLSFTIWINLECDTCEISSSSDEVDQLFYYFWYCPMGMSDDKFSCAEIRDFLFEYLDRLAIYKTRIVQKNLIIFQTFRLEYFDNERWNLIYKHSALNIGGIEFPDTKGRKKIYY